MVRAAQGNIYRAEILFKAAVHPELKGAALTTAQFDRVWAHSVALLRRGYETGSILTATSTCGAGRRATGRLTLVSGWLPCTCACVRQDADPEKLRRKVASAKKKNIGQLLMDQAFFAGPVLALSR